MKKFKKYLSLTLALCMLFSSFSVIAAPKNDDKVIKFTGSEVIFEADGEYTQYEGRYIQIEYDTATGGTCLQANPLASAQLSKPEASEKPELRFDISFPEDGVYTIWLRSTVASVSENSIHFKYGDKNWGSKELSVYEDGDWHWQILSNEFFKKGTYTIGLRPRELRTRIDNILITNNVAFVPNGASGMEKPENFIDGQYYNIPPIVPPEGHPRLLVREKDIPLIKANLESEENKPMYEQVLKNVADDNDCILPLDPASPTNTNTKCLGIIEGNAFLYLIDNENNLENGKKAIELYKNYISSLVCTKSAAYQTRELGYTIYIGALVYDWCYDIMSDEDRELFINTWVAYGMQLEIGWPPISQANMNSHAIEGQLMTDLISMAIACYDERPDIWNLVGGRFFDEVIPCQNLLYSGGYFTEGSNYGMSRLEGLMENMWIFRRMGFDNIYNKEIENAGYSYIMSLKSSGEPMPYGDIWLAGSGVQGSFSTNFYLLYSYYKNPYFKYMFYKLNPSGTITGQSNGGLGPVYFLLTNVEKIEQKSIEDLPLAGHYGVTTSTILARTSWDDSKEGDGVLVRMNFNKYFFGGHQHADSGAFEIHYKGGLALDTGLYQSASWERPDGKIETSLAYGSEHDQNYHKLSIAHNVMLVRGANANEFGGYQSTTKYDGGQVANIAGLRLNGTGDVQSRTNGAITNYDDIYQEGVIQGKPLSYDIGPDPRDPEYSFVKADITDAYPKSSVEKYSRQMMFINFKDKEYPGAMIVFDNVKSADKQREKAWLLHTEEEPQLTENTITVKRTTNKAQGRLINETLLPDVSDIEYRKIGGEGHEFEVDGHNYTAVNRYATYEHGKWRVELVPKTKKQQDYFLNVLQISDNKDEIVPLKSELIKNDDDYIGVKIKDKVALFARTGESLNKKIELSVPGEEKNLSFIITGLKSGTWQLIKDDKVVATYDVDKTHDTAYFKADAGNYTIKWKYKANIPEKDLYYANLIEEKNASVIDVKIDKYYEEFENEPIEKDGTLYLPYKELLDKADYEYKVNDDNSITLTINKIDVTVKPYDNKVYLGTKVHEMKLAPFMENGLLYVPITQFADKISMKATWYDLSKKLIIQILGRKDEDERLRIKNSSDPARIKLYDANHSGTNVSVSPFDAVDANNGTYWAESGKGVWIEGVFEEVSTVSKVGIYWHVGDTRIAKFEIHISEDGENYTKVYEGVSDGVTAGFEYYELPPDVRAKYVRIVGFENNTNAWNSIKELEFYK